MFKNILVISILSFFLKGCLQTTNQKAEINQPNTTRSEVKSDFNKGIVKPKDYIDNVGDTLKILSWNVEHFVDSYDNPYTENNREDNSENMQGRVELLVEALRIEDADIVVLQEFEHVQFLKDISNNYLSDMGYTFFADNESPNWYMNVVVMSRVPLGIIYGYGAVTTPIEYIDEETGQEQYETQSRINTRLWSVDVLVNDNYSFLLTGVHLKAGRGPRNEAMRMGQIKFLKGQYERFLNENPDKNILIVGDFNATPDSEEIQYMLDGNSSAQFVDNLPQEVFSHPAKVPKWRIDHVLPNTNMQPELVKNSLKVKYYFDKEVQDNLADHLPLVAEFVTKDSKIN
jgi:endonuclease/exonuclease/phosphatase family metal-dependent hydrolase